jgi:hypothetical protein
MESVIYDALDFAAFFFITWIVLIVVFSWLPDHPDVDPYEDDGIMKAVSAFIAFCITWLLFGPK